MNSRQLVLNNMQHIHFALNRNSGVLSPPPLQHYWWQQTQNYQLNNSHQVKKAFWYSSFDYLGEKSVLLQRLIEPDKEVGPGKHGKRLWTGQGYRWFAHKIEWCFGDGEWLEGIGVNVAVTVMPRAEYELYVSGAGSPRLTWA